MAPAAQARPESHPEDPCQGRGRRHSLQKHPLTAASIRRAQRAHRTQPTQRHLRAHPAHTHARTPRQHCGGVRAARGCSGLPLPDGRAAAGALPPSSGRVQTLLRTRRSWTSLPQGPRINSAPTGCPVQGHPPPQHTPRVERSHRSSQRRKLSLGGSSQFWVAGLALCPGLGPRSQIGDRKWEGRIQLSLKPSLL